jgi:hypothetical protein
MFIRLFAWFWVAFCSLAANAATVTSAALPTPTVAYAADRVMQTEAGTFTGRVHAAAGKERNEFNAAGMQSVMILRPDLAQGYMLMPAQHVYQQVDYLRARQQSGAASEDLVETTIVGTETIEGRETTKYRLVMKDGSAGGFMWFTREGIAVKMDLLQKEGGRKTRMTITLTNLEIGSQDPALFEVPAGYRALPSFMKAPR